MKLSNGIKMSFKTIRYRERIDSRRKSFRRIVMLTILAILLLVKEPGVSAEDQQNQQGNDGRKSEGKILAAKSIKTTKEIGKTTPDPKNITALLESSFLHGTARQSQVSGLDEFQQHQNLTGKLGDKFNNNGKGKSNLVSWVVTFFVGWSLVSSYIAHYFYEKCKHLLPLKKKVVQQNGNLWKVTMAYNSLEDDFDSSVRSREEIRNELRKVKAELELVQGKAKAQDEQIHNLEIDLKCSKDTREKDQLQYEKEKKKFKEECLREIKIKENTTLQQRNNYEKELNDLKIANEDLSKWLQKQHRETVKSEYSLKREKEKAKAAEAKNEKYENKTKSLKNEIEELKKLVKHYEEEAEEAKAKLLKEKQDSELAPAEEEIPLTELVVEVEQGVKNVKLSFGGRVRKRISSLFQRKNKKNKVKVEDPGRNDQNSMGPGGDIPKRDLHAKSRKLFWVKKASGSDEKGG